MLREGERVTEARAGTSAPERSPGALALGAAERAPARRQYRRLYRLMALTDAACVVLAFALGTWVRYRGHAPTSLLPITLLAPCLTVALFYGFRLYETHRFTAAEEFRRVFLAVSIGMMMLVTLGFWTHATLARAWIASTWLFTLALTLGSRRLWHAQIRRERAIGRLSYRTVIVGANREAASLAASMRDPESGFSVIGAVHTSQEADPGPELPVLGDIHELQGIVRREGADCIFVASSAVSAEEMKQIARIVRLEGLEVRVSASLPVVLASRLSAQPVGGVMSLALRPARLSRPQRALKRAFDLTVAGIGLILSAPLWALAALAIKLDSPGPVLYRQRRVGEGGRPFVMLKFRSMYVDAEQRLAELRPLSEVDGPLFKLRDDPRVTRVGRWLRRWSLDELPQLWNVIRGEMSLVGPRPPLPEEVAAYEEWHFARLEAPPGITGLWQVSGRSELSFEDYVRRDLFYIENWSLAYDLFIVLKTIPIVLSRRGAY
ncbi:UDP-glucose:undecaprenyl-phosphate glucose-1-phosphate transferase [bacterium HR12]|nr:UDP-glucose:undecaprenyl-phosphate glucose-1-phosphate transferase [bacterium HR12]